MHRTKQTYPHNDRNNVTAEFVKATNAENTQKQEKTKKKGQQGNEHDKTKKTVHINIGIGKKQENPQTATTTPEEKEEGDTTEDEPLYKEKKTDPNQNALAHPAP